MNRQYNSTFINAVIVSLLVFLTSCGQLQTTHNLIDRAPSSVRKFGSCNQVINNIIQSPKVIQEQFRNQSITPDLYKQFQYLNPEFKDVGIDEVLNSSKSTPDNFKQKIFHLKKSLLKYISNLFTSDKKKVIRALNESYGQGSYKYRGLLGVGAFGGAHLVEDSNGSTVVVKYLNNLKHKEMFHNEISVLEKLDFDNIVRIEKKSRAPPFFMMKFEGKNSLKHLYVSENIYEYSSKYVDDFFDLMNQAIQSMVYLEEKGIVHLDIKPENFIVTDTGRLKLIDFGLADTLENPKNLIGRGTPEYVAPEVYSGNFKGQADMIGHHSDQYSLGIMIGKQARKLLTMTYRKSPKDVKTISRLKKIIEISDKMSKSNLDERFLSFEELLASFKEL